MSWISLSNHMEYFRSQLNPKAAASDANTRQPDRWMDKHADTHTNIVRATITVTDTAIDTSADKGTLAYGVTNTIKFHSGSIYTVCIYIHSFTYICIYFYMMSPIFVGFLYTDNIENL